MSPNCEFSHDEFINGMAYLGLALIVNYYFYPNLVFFKPILDEHPFSFDRELNFDEKLLNRLSLKFWLEMKQFINGMTDLGYASQVFFRPNLGYFIKVYIFDRELALEVFLTKMN